LTQITDLRTAPPYIASVPARFQRPLQEHMMNTNEGRIDRALRVLVGLALIGLAATGTVGAWAWIGAVPLATGLIGWCPAYTMLGISTCPAKASK
jgi:Protein of unknown function (DUF2892)